LTNDTLARDGLFPVNVIKAGFQGFVFFRRGVDCKGVSLEQEGFPVPSFRMVDWPFFRERIKMIAVTKPP
jgi:hypothetical protein